MEREIKFRTWDGHTMKDVFTIDLFDSGENTYRMNDDIDSHYDKWPLMQFTGLQDKNGKDIYEGDIYKYKSSEQGKQDQFYETKKVVQFYKGSFGFEEWNTDNEGRLKANLTHHAAHHATRDLYYIDFDIEIIGNIHENKNLL